MAIPFYDPQKSYEENCLKGPFGAFADGEVFQDKGDSKFDFLGCKLYSPFGIPAGPLVNGAFVKAALDKGFDIPVYKTVRTSARKSQSWPNVVGIEAKGDVTAGAKVRVTETDGTPLSISNSFGVPSYYPAFWQEDLAKAAKYAKKGQVVVGSFQGTKQGNGDVQAYLDDFVLAAKLVKATGVRIMEVNLSCPNEGTSELLCFDTARVKTIVERIKHEIGAIPLIIKIAYFWDKNALEELIQKVGNFIGGVAAINTIPAQVVDRKGKQALPGAVPSLSRGKERSQSGVGGRAIKWAGLDTAKRLKEIRAKHKLSYQIIGMGGVITPDDFQEYRDAGANVVMSATGAMWNPYLAKEIKERINAE